MGARRRRRPWTTRAVVPVEVGAEVIPLRRAEGSGKKVALVAVFAAREGAREALERSKGGLNSTPLSPISRLAR